MERPIVGIGIAIIKNGKMLFGKRKSDHAHGVWSRPGGKLDPGESREECATREAYEETGLSIKNIEYLVTSNDIYEEENRHFVSIWMKSEYDSGELTLMEPDKFEIWDRFDLDSLPQPVFRGVLEVVTQYF